MIYLLDANVLITAHDHYYPIDGVPEFWEWLVHHAEAGVIKMPIEIFEEIEDGGEQDLLYIWVTKHKKMLVLEGDVEPKHVKDCIAKGYASDLKDDEIAQMGQDPFLVAHAMAAPNDRCVVTTEASKPTSIRQNRRIPDVCTTMGVKCFNTFQMTRALGFKTSWKNPQSGGDAGN